MWRNEMYFKHFLLHICISANYVLPRTFNAVYLVIAFMCGEETIYLYLRENENSEDLY